MRRSEGIADRLRGEVIECRLAPSITLRVAPVPAAARQEEPRLQVSLLVEQLCGVPCPGHFAYRRQGPLGEQVLEVARQRIAEGLFAQ